MGEHLDLVAGTRTVVGKAFVMTDPRKGIVIQDTGRIVFDASEHVSFDAGISRSPLQGSRSTHLQRACRAGIEA